MAKKGTLASRLRASRKALEMTQPELATKAGVSQSLITQLERGIIKGTGSVGALAAALGVKPEWLAGEKEGTKK